MTKKVIHEIKQQLSSAAHPVNGLTSAFKRLYKQEYCRYFLKRGGFDATAAFDRLAAQIEIQNAITREKYPEDGINFSDEVVGEAKKYIVVALLTLLKFYEPCFDNGGIAKSDGVMLNWGYYQQKLTTLVVRVTLEGSVLKIVQSICQYDTLQDEKALRARCKQL